MEQLINKVAESGILTMDLAPYVPADDTLAEFDLKPFLFREMILKEKDYRAALLLVDWKSFEGKHVALHCSVDAIIPVWGYMLATSYLQPFAASIFYGTPAELRRHIINSRIAATDLTEYTDKRVVIKGCGDTPIPDAAYVAATALLRSVAKSVMYGEPCSTVPIYKKPMQPRTAS